MIPCLGDGNTISPTSETFPFGISLENDSPSRGRKHVPGSIQKELQSV